MRRSLRPHFYLAAAICVLGAAGSGCVGDVEGSEGDASGGGQTPDAAAQRPDADAPVDPPEDDRNVVIIGWDGVQRDHLNECMLAKLPECPDGLPNLQELSDRRFFDLTVTTAATATKPGWVEILTGYDAASLGIPNNSVFQPVPAGYSVLEKLEAHFGPDEVATLFLAGKPAHVGGNCDTEPQEPWCEVKANLDYFENDLQENENVGNLALDLLSQHADERIVAFFHFWDPDHTGHKNGESSKAYSRAIRDDDAWLGRIVAHLEELGLLEKTLIYVVTDHGFDEGRSSHKNAPHGFLVTNDPQVARSGDRKDLAPTILQRFGVPLHDDGPSPAVHGVPLDSVPSGSLAEGQAYLDYPGAPVCGPGLALISLKKWAKPNGEAWQCLNPTGKRGDKSGYCTQCGDGACQGPENRCNCPADCGSG